MTDLLKPPLEHDLPPARAADIRRAVLRSTLDARRRHTRRGAWLLVPAAAALTVAGVAVGLRPVQTPSVLGSPSPAPTVGSTRLSAEEVDTDAGPLSHADAVRAVDQLLAADATFGAGASRHVAHSLADVVLGRRITTPLGEGTFVVFTDDQGSTWWYAAVPGVFAGESGPVAGPAARNPRVPSTNHPVVRMDVLNPDVGYHEDADRPDATARDLYSAHLYVVAPSVDRVEVRMTVEGIPGPWYTAPAHDGYAYVPAVTPGPHSTSENVDKVTHNEDRAFDHDGNPVRIAGR